MTAKPLAALICAALLIALTASLPEPFALEKTLILAAGDTRNHITLPLAYTLHYIGKYGAWLVAALAAFYLARRKWQTAVFMVIVPALAAASTAILKIAVARIRPDILDHLVQQTDASFPSGHSTFAAALAFAFILRYQNPAAWTLGISFMLAMGWSRLMLGVHYPVDVLSGWCVGILAALSAERVSRVVGLNNK